MTVEETTVSDSKTTPYTPGPNAVDISPSKDGGVLKEIIKEGEGDEFPSSGNKVTVHYHGTFLDGSVFDSSKDRGEPFEFNLGKGNVIKAWDIGVATMKKGEVCMLTCKPEYAYGKSGSPPKIPGDTTLLFEISMISWQKEDLSKNKDGGILRTILVSGDGYTTPNEGSLCEVHLVGKYNNEIFQDKTITFNLGEGSEHGVVRGVERALEKFHKGEKSKLQLKPMYAFKSEGSKEFNIPPDADVEYIVELKSFEKCKDAWELDTSEKIAQARLFKEKATSYYRDKKYNVALRLYTKMLEYVDSDSGFDEEQNKDRKSLLIAGKLNLALVYLKTEKFYEAKNECDSVLEVDPENVKGLYRRGLAYLSMKDPDKAKPDFEAVLKIEPNNKAAANDVIMCNNVKKQQLRREKNLYANMFEKFAKVDKVKEEITNKPHPDGMKTLGEWGRDEKDGELSKFEKENPDVIMLDKTGEFKDM